MKKAESPVKPLHMLIEESLLAQIEDYRFKHRFHTRVETIKALLRIGLASDKPASSEKARKG